jgi:PAS domain-containing protein
MHSHQHEATVDASADAVFTTVTDLERLSEWNTVITTLSERPERLEPGAEWVVQMHAMGQRWESRSTVLDHDPAGRSFRYRSCTDDGNPSWADWTWTVTPVDDERSRVVVSWVLHPQTFWRRTLLVRIRARQLRRTELPRSLSRLAEAASVAER